MPLYCCSSIAASTEEASSIRHGTMGIDDRMTQPSDGRAGQDKHEIGDIEIGPCVSRKIENCGYWQRIDGNRFYATPHCF